MIIFNILQILFLSVIEVGETTELVMSCNSHNYGTYNLKVEAYSIIYWLIQTNLCQS